VKVHDTQTTDRRVQKTRRLLLEAFGSLLVEKRYDSIVIREILDRANVGRSTFYTHFRDKDALLVSAIRDLLRRGEKDAPLPAQRSERAIRFSRPLFEHIAHHLREGKTRMGHRSRTIVHERLRKVLVEHLAEEVAKGATGARRPASGRVPGDLLVQHVASTFVTVLNWWVDSGGKLLAAEVDERFRALVLPSLAAALD
jgi:AcrR family transcriptional regulator